MNAPPLASSSWPEIDQRQALAERLQFVGGRIFFAS